MLSVIVATYNRPRELGLVLEGLRQQRDAEFEVIVADDGSTPETRDGIDKVRGDFPAPLLHVWQEDQGFRLAAIRNRAIRKASGDILVFLDGDCIPFPGFLAAHRSSLEPGTYLTGQRLRLDESRSMSLGTERIRQGGLHRIPSLRERVRETFQRGRACTHRLRELEGRPKLIACNASAYHKDVLGINGFDEKFVGWGGEDDDFARRLRRMGLRPKSVIGRARCLHLHHRPDPTFQGKVRWGPNHAYLHRGYFLTRCRQGIRKREVEDLSLHFLHAPEGVPRPPPGKACEVDVIFAPIPPGAGFHLAAEIRVIVHQGGEPDPTLAAECDVLLSIDPAVPPPGIPDAIRDALDTLI